MITLEDARHLANVRAKSQELYARGYRGEMLTEDVVEVTGPNGSYRIDLMRAECECPHHGRWGWCSHVWGWPKLLTDQEREQERGTTCDG